MGKNDLLQLALKTEDTKEREKLLIESSVYFPYLKPFISNVKEMLSSPESALLLRDAYYDNFLSKKDDPVEHSFASILYRKEEYVGDEEILGKYIDKYIRLDIKRLFGITFIEYMSLTPRDFFILNNKAEEYVRIQSEEMRKLQASVDDNVKRHEKMGKNAKMPKMPTPPPVNGGMNLINEMSSALLGE